MLYAPALAYRVADGAITNGVIEGASKARVEFSDGSQIAVLPGARMRIEQVTAHGAQVELGRGQVSINIVKAPQNAWSVKAGPYRVQVTGTAFDVRWREDDKRFELNLQRGSVIVSGPPLPSPLSLQAGQTITSFPGGPVTVTGPKIGRANSALPADSEPISKLEPKEAIVPPDSLPDNPAPERSAEPSSTTWQRWVAQGKFQEVLDAARRRGLDDVVSNGNLAELSALADAARYVRNPNLARQALLSERKRFPKTSAARDAAFFLGGLETEGSRAALEWYERYLAESPRGHYAAQALGRRMVIVHRQSGREASRALAESYLQRFPKGPYADSARKILDRSLP